MKKTNAGFAYKNRKRYYYKKFKSMILEYSFIAKPMKRLKLRHLKNMCLNGVICSSALELSDYYI